MKKFSIICIVTMVLGFMVIPVYAIDSDGDGIEDSSDTCPLIPNGPDLGVCYAMSSYSPDIGETCVSNGECQGDYIDCIMDQEDYVCDCTASFDCDFDVDANDIVYFLENFGREQYYMPCTTDNPCMGDFECDGDVDADDVEQMMLNFHGHLGCGVTFCFSPCITCIEGNYVYSCTYE